MEQQEPSKSFAHIKICIPMSGDNKSTDALGTAELSKVGCLVIGKGWVMCGVVPILPVKVFCSWWEWSLNIYLFTVLVQVYVQEVTSMERQHIVSMIPCLPHGSEGN